MNNSTAATALLTAPTPFQLLDVRALCARTHHSQLAGTRIIRVDAGYGRDASFEGSDAVVTVGYRPLSGRGAGRDWHADYAFLRGQWILWAD